MGRLLIGLSHVVVTLLKALKGGKEIALIQLCLYIFYFLVPSILNITTHDYTIHISKAQTFQ